MLAGVIADRALHVLGARQGAFGTTASRATVTEVVDRALHLLGVRPGTTILDATGDAGPALTIIKHALRLIGVLAEGDEPGAAQAQDALSALNGLVLGWEAEGVPEATVTGLTDVVPLPARHRDAIAYGLALLIAPEYGKEPSAVIAQIAAARQARLLLEYRTAPIPALANLLSAWEGLGVPVTTRPLLSATVLAVPAHYTEAVVYALAVRLAPEFGMDVKPAVATLAAEREQRMLQEYRADPLKALDEMLLAWELQNIPETTHPVVTATELGVPDAHTDAVVYGLAMRLASETGVPVRPDVAMKADETERRLMAAYLDLKTLRVPREYLGRYGCGGTHLFDLDEDVLG